MKTKYIEWYGAFLILDGGLDPVCPTDSGVELGRENMTFAVDHGERSLVARIDEAHARVISATAAVQALLASSAKNGVTLRARIGDGVSFSIVEAGGCAICRFFSASSDEVDLDVIGPHIAEVCGVR